VNADLHLTETFAAAEREFPDLMERYSSRLAEAETADERVAIMRAGLRETIRARYPMAEAREVVAVEPDRQGALEL
jgi:hypothetical protein